MVEFKAKADRIIKKRWGIKVEHVDAGESYEHHFYRVRGEKAPTNGGIMYGWPTRSTNWCNSGLKMRALSRARKQRGNIIYIGIAADEPGRLHVLSDARKSPLVEAGWTEADCRRWCENNDLLSPIYTTSTRGGCWFCHNQSVNQLRLLRKDYPDLWALMLKWDSDSPVTFKADGHTVHDFDRRFQLEDEGMIYVDDKVFRWSMLDDELNYRLF